MAEGKNKIIVYADWIEIFEPLSEIEAGRLIKHFFQYVNDKNPNPPDRLTELLFNGSIKPTLKRDLKNWLSQQERNKINGSNGGRPKKEKPTETEKTQSVISEPTQTHSNPKKGVKDNVRVIDKDNVNDNLLLKKEAKADLIILNPFQESFRPHWDKWILYKKNEHKATFKRIETQQTAFKHLLELSKNNEDTAVKIIEQSIANQWKGLFELKNLGNGKPEKRSLEQATRDYLAQ